MALAGAFPPWNLLPLAIVGLAVLLAATDSAGPVRRAAMGLVFGVAFFGPLLSWIAGFGILPWVLLVLTESAFPAAWGLATAALPRRDRAVPWAVGAASTWVLVMELGRARFPLGGFPWGTVGAPFVGTPLAWLAPVLGGAGVGGVVAFIAALGVLALRRQLRALAAGSVALALALAAAGLLVRPPQSTGRLRVAVVQGNVPLPAGPATPERARAVLANHVELTGRLPPGGVDLVIWPEDVLDLDDPLPAAGAPAPEPLSTLSREQETWLVAGVTNGAGAGRFRNSAVSVDPWGRLVDRYDKTRPVPFGEYVPFRGALGFYPALRNVPRDMVPGTAARPMVVGAHRVGTPISYEVAFARIVREFARQGAEALVVLTNTSSYGPHAPTAEQELQLARMRAAELSLWAVQSAPSGISAVIDPRGRVVARTDLFRPAILSVTVGLQGRPAPFAAYGEWAALGLSAVGTAAAAGIRMVGARTDAARRPLQAPPTTIR